MTHPLTETLARRMHTADGAPERMANGASGPDAYRSMAEAALDALVELCQQDGHMLLLTELDAVGLGYGRTSPSQTWETPRPGETVGQYADRISGGPAWRDERPEAPTCSCGTRKVRDRAGAAYYCPASPGCTPAAS